MSSVNKKKKTLWEIWLRYIRVWFAVQFNLFQKQLEAIDRILNRMLVIAQSEHIVWIGMGAHTHFIATFLYFSLAEQTISPILGKHASKRHNSIIRSWFIDKWIDGAEMIFRKNIPTVSMRTCRRYCILFCLTAIYNTIPVEIMHEIAWIPTFYYVHVALPNETIKSNAITIKIYPTLSVFRGCTLPLVVAKNQH